MTVLFDRYTLGDHLILNNRVVMAPLTRTRSSPGDVPNSLMEKYYRQRATAGLIITEATDVSARSNGYAWTPGIYTQPQVNGWRLITRGVHREGGRIFLQVWHVGRMGHSSMMPQGSPPWGATDEPAAQSDVFIHGADNNPRFVRASTPRAIATEEIANVVQEFMAAFRNAQLAQFDGVEIHGANGYLFDQFMNSTLNTRSDIYGGQTAQNRTRLLLEVVNTAIEVFGAGKVGVRVSPFGKFNSMPADPRAEETLLYLCEALSLRGIAYLHVVYQLMPSGNVNDNEFNDVHLSEQLVTEIRRAFNGTLIFCGGFDKPEAQRVLDGGWADLIAFGRPYIANPDLVARVKHDWPLAVADPSTYYTRDGEHGYTDFPFYETGPL